MKPLSSSPHAAQQQVASARATIGTFTPLAQASTERPRVGMIAGWGNFPLRVARALIDQGCDVYCLGVKDHASDELRALCHTFQPVGLAKLGAAIRFFQRHQVQQATMAGKIHKVLLFRKLYWLKHLPDLTFVRHFYPHFVTHSRDRKDDTILGGMVDAFASHGIHFAPATDFAPELLVKYGQLSGGRLSHSQRKDIEFGWQLAREMGRLDVGQSVAVKGQAVLAVEAVEGTDECIRRAGQLCPAGGFTVVKVAKPQQDMRFDVPTVGLGTLEMMAAAGGRVLAIEAERTILIDEADFIARANAAGISVVAVRDGQVAEDLPRQVA
ncbi:MAG: UDP-2,3-diacylglucosamine diphosphatase LpxI [Planctomycetales bacterium]|nr:UDP-2,3-diacylglucosamine diphosphatase LpxI [Planctomycetales bacterium]